MDQLNTKLCDYIKVWNIFNVDNGYAKTHYAKRLGCGKGDFEKMKKSEKDDNVEQKAHNFMTFEKFHPTAPLRKNLYEKID